MRARDEFKAKIAEGLNIDLNGGNNSGFSLRRDLNRPEVISEASESVSNSNTGSKLASALPSRKNSVLDLIEEDHSEE